MKILALENSSSLGSVALLDGQREPSVLEFRNDRKDSGLFFEALEGWRERLTNLDTIVVGLGPGSYAGVRIALSAAMGLQMANDVKLCGLSSLCALATNENEYCVIGDARRESYFFARVRAREISGEIDLYGREELTQRLQEINFKLPIYSFEKLADFPEAEICYPSAAVLARLIARASTKVAHPPLEPIYLRPPHITAAKKAAAGI